MKILKETINQASTEGTVKLEPEEEEDMYFLYNLISAGDEVETITVRNVVSESKSGVKSKTRMQVEKIDFDAEQGTLRLNGKNIRENEHIKMFQYHTVEIELNRPLKITKGSWDAVNLEILAEASNPIKKADVAAITMQEGLALVCLIKANLTKTCAKIDRPFPKQKHGAKHDEVIQNFMNDIYNAVKTHINFDAVKAILIGSPGFLNEDFYAYMVAKAISEECTEITKNKAKFLRVHTSVGHLRAIDEMLSDERICAQLGDVKAASEVRSLERFHVIMGSDPDRVSYGYEQVKNADQHLAIDELLVSDSVYRSSDYEKRKTYIALMASVTEHGGKVLKFSSLHVSGQQLDLYTGVAAILRFPLPEVAEEESEDEDDFDLCKRAYDGISAQISEVSIAEKARGPSQKNRSRGNSLVGDSSSGKARSRGNSFA